MPFDKDVLTPSVSEPIPEGELGAITFAARLIIMSERANHEIRQVALSLMEKYLQPPSSDADTPTTET